MRREFPPVQAAPSPGEPQWKRRQDPRCAGPSPKGLQAGVELKNEKTSGKKHSRKRHGDENSDLHHIPEECSAETTSFPFLINQPQSKHHLPRGGRIPTFQKCDHYQPGKKEQDGYTICHVY
jgi:hypothetical protein